MDKIYKLVEQSISEMESMGLNFKTYYNDYSITGIFFINGKPILTLSVDEFICEFSISPKEEVDIIPFLIGVLQGYDLTQYLNMLGSALFFRAQESILDKYDESSEDPDMEPLFDTLKDARSVDFKEISRWNNGDIDRIYYSVN